MVSINMPEQTYIANDLVANLHYSIVHPHTNPAFKWEPELDITLYELAVCLPYLTGSLQDVDSLADEFRRHFTAVTP